MGFLLSPLGGRRGGKKDHKVFQGEWVGCWGLGQREEKGLIKFEQDLNQTTRLKANAFRRKFATQSQSSPLFALFERAGWRVFESGRKGANEKSTPLDSNLNDILG